MQLSVKQRQTLIFSYIWLLIPCAVLLLVKGDNSEPSTVLMHGLLIVFGYIASVADLKKRIIPNKLVLTMLIVWSMAIIPNLYINSSKAVLILTDSVLGFAFSGGLFMLVYVISKKGLGGGDVKFMAAAGLYLGFDGAISSVFIGTVIAALTGGLLIILKKIGRKDPIPLVPFLYAGIMTTVLLL